MARTGGLLGLGVLWRNRYILVLGTFYIYDTSIPRSHAITEFPYIHEKKFPSVP